MSEMQDPVFEYSPTEAQNPRVTGDTLAQNSTVSTDDCRPLSVRKTDDWLPPEPTSVPSGGPCVRKTSGCYHYLTACVSEQFVELGIRNQ
jgi:hypothetical protein